MKWWDILAGIGTVIAGVALVATGNIPAGAALLGSGGTYLAHCIAKRKRV